MTVGGNLRDAWAVYRLLFRRSVMTAAIVYGAIALLDAAASTRGSHGVRVLFGFVSLVLGIAGPLIVQAGLVEIVRNVHEGKPPKRIVELFEAGQRRFWRLLGASILYGIAVGVGLVLLIVPGLIVAARGALLVPLIVLEGMPVRDAIDRSVALVRGHTRVVLGTLAVAYLLTESVWWIMLYAVRLSHAADLLFRFAWSSITVPFSAHVLSVLYYRLADPERPVVHPSVFTWGSVWRGH
jgi:hypothetical protein